MIDLSHAYATTTRPEEMLVAAAAEYGPPGGCLALRSAAAEWYGVTPDRIAVTTGGSLALACALGSLKRSCRLLCPRPWYPVYPRLVALFGLELVSYDLLPERQWQPDPAQFLSLAQCNSAAILVNWPSNPTGVIASDDTLSALRVARDNFGCEIISDETYGDFVYDGRPPFCLADYLGWESIVAIKSGSKLLGCPGERIGFAIAEPNRLISICHVHWTLALSPPASGQYLVLNRFGNGLRRKLDASLAELGGKRDRLARLLQGSGRFELEPSQGGTFLWINAKDFEGDGDAFAVECARRGVKVAAGPAFGAQESAWFRTSFAVDSAELETAAYELIAAAGGAAHAVSED